MNGVGALAQVPGVDGAQDNTCGQKRLPTTGRKDRET